MYISTNILMEKSKNLFIRNSLLICKLLCINNYWQNALLYLSSNIFVFLFWLAEQYCIILMQVAVKLYAIITFGKEGYIVDFNILLAYKQF